MGLFTVQVCGPLRVERDGSDLTPKIPAGQARLLVVFLVLHRGRPVSRGELVDALWPVAAPEHADRDVSALLSRLRAALGPDCLPTGAESVMCVPDGGRVDLDDAYGGIARAESAIADGNGADGWGAALSSLAVARRGFLPGVELPWAQRQRARLRDVLLTSYELLGEAGLILGGPKLLTAQRMGLEIVEDEPLRESGYRLAMRACIARGNHAEALQVYVSLRRRLARDLGVDPGPETRALYESVLAASAAGTS